MQQLRFQNQNIFVMQKSVQFCGKTIVKSKKKVRWVIKHNQDTHIITSSISFYSGKKKVTHNGHTIMDILDSNQCLDFIVTMGYQRMIFSLKLSENIIKTMVLLLPSKMCIRNPSPKFIRKSMICDSFFITLHIFHIFNCLKLKWINMNYNIISHLFKVLMITTKLKKQCTPKCLLIEFSNTLLPPALQQFFKTCKQEGIKVRRDDLKGYQINYYFTENDQSLQIRNIKLENVPTNITFVLSLLYVNSQQVQQQLASQQPTKRTLLLRQGLDTKFYHDYEFQNTQSQYQSMIYLCELSASIINSRLQKDIGFFDQRTQSIKSINHQNEKEKLWKNMFFQIPGLGKEKCLAIAQKYTSYQALLQDYQNGKQLKNVNVCKGTKEVKLGSILANRIYRCLFIENGLQSINDQ